MTRSDAFAIDPDQLLDAVPVTNQSVRLEMRDDGMIVFLPLQRRWWMQPPFSWLMNYRTERGLALDSLGREVYEACDGQSTVESIIEAFAQRHQVRFHDARLSVLQFLRSLVQRNAVALVVAEDDEPRPAGPKMSVKTRRQRKARAVRRKEALA